MSELIARLIEREAVLLHRIEVLQAEVRAWRNADTWHELTDYMDECDDHSHAAEIKEAMARTDALEPNP